VSPLINEGTDLVLRFGSSGGQTLVQSSSPLTRLNYFDGKFLRADDLRREQSYLRQLVQYSNQGLGAGIVYGMDTTLDAQGRLMIGPGLAMDSDGRTLLIPAAATLDIGALIDGTRRLVQPKQAATAMRAGSAEFAPCVDATSAPTDGTTPGSSLYVICVGHAESLCGTEDVYGRLCEEACVTATDRPYLVEGVIVRAMPLMLGRTLVTSNAVPLNTIHLRSRIASAYFEDERHYVEKLISRAGLALDTWCMGAEAASVGCVPLAVVARAGTSTIFLDAWTARRERIEAPARRYWAWRMAMRPWDVYLAQILQFQCQLHEVLGVAPDPGGSTDPCASQQKVLSDAARFLSNVDQSYSSYVTRLAARPLPAAGAPTPDTAFQLQGGAADLALLRGRIDSALKVMIAGPRERVLINGGIVELPPAGYLPIVLSADTVNAQVRRLLGEGLDLRFCVVRPDFVAHALEEAQHMERISLLTGLDNANAKPEVDILVPDGQIITATPPKLSGFDSQVRINSTALALAASSAASAARSASAALTATAKDNPPLIVHGAGRGERLSGGGAAFYFAGGQEAPAAQQIIDVVNGVSKFVGASLKVRSDVLKKAAAPAAAPEPFAPMPMVADSLIARYSVKAAESRMQPVPSDVAPAPTTIATRMPSGAIAITPALVSLWATMRSDRDPFAMGSSDTTAMNLELVLSMERTLAAAETHALLRIRVFGNFSVVNLPVPTTAGSQMAGHFSGTYVVQTVFDGTASAAHAPTFEVDVALTRGSAGDAGTLRVVLGGPQSSLSMLADIGWGGLPTEATLTLSIGPATQQVVATPGQPLMAMMLIRRPDLVELVSAHLVDSADALTEGSALRTLSSSALELIGEEMTRANQGGSAFVDAALQQLFPPPPPPVDDLTVQGTLDWVLFHRRRTKRCATPAAAPVPSPERRYQVYHHLAESDRELRAIVAALRTPAGIANISFRRVDVVTFAGGLPSLLTSPADVLRDWAAQQPGNVLMYGAIATPIAADAPLESARLARVVQAIAPASAVDPNGTGNRFETLPQVPAALAVPGTDGIIFLVTKKAVRLTCQDVYQVVPDSKVQDALSSNNLALLLTMGQVTHVASVQFEDDSIDPTPASLSELKDAWTKIGEGSVLNVRVYQKPNDSSAGDMLARARTIAAQLGAAAGVGVDRFKAGGAWPTGPTCPVITLLVVAAPTMFGVRFVAARQSHDSAGPMHVAVPGTRQPVWNLDARGEAPEADFQTDVTPILRALNDQFDLVELATPNDPTNKAVQQRLNLVAKELAKAKLLRPQPKLLTIGLSAADSHFLTDEPPEANEVVFVGRLG
jgi:hypothetical protein